MARQEFNIEVADTQSAIAVARDLLEQGFDVDVDPMADHLSDHPIEVRAIADHTAFTDAGPNSKKAKDDAARIISEVTKGRRARQGNGRKVRAQPHSRS